MEKSAQITSANTVIVKMVTYSFKKVKNVKREGCCRDGVDGW
jgi:hypothetical protein